MSQQFRAANPEEIILHMLDMMTLVFHRPSGLTHIVADPVPAILEVMQGGASTPSQIIAALENSFDLEEGADVENVVLARLDELYALGLVERVST
ncbi:MAG: HPr-rel-A system PqqD family peptide chaperone [Parasphingorhabdus sp.]